MRALLVILGLALPAEVGGDSPVKGWTLSGWVLAEGAHDPDGIHRPIVGQEVVLRRLWRPIWCVFCLGGYVEHATTTTGEKGDFRFTDRKRGSYEVAVRCSPGSRQPFLIRDTVGRMERGEYHALIEYSTKNCD
jgi:hypothetical protein